MTCLIQPWFIVLLIIVDTFFRNWQSSWAWLSSMRGYGTPRWPMPLRASCLGTTHATLASPSISSPPVVWVASLMISVSSSVHRWVSWASLLVIVAWYSGTRDFPFLLTADKSVQCVVPCLGTPVWDCRPDIQTVIIVIYFCHCLSGKSFHQVRTLFCWQTLLFVSLQPKLWCVRKASIQTAHLKDSWAVAEKTCIRVMWWWLLLYGSREALVSCHWCMAARL